jgi:ActR/RegA family two-component response regulator
VEGAGPTCAAILCHDRPDLQRSVARLLVSSGFDVPVVTESFSAVYGLVREHAAVVAVVALPLTGMSGLLAVRALRAAAPACEVVLMSPSDALQPAAVQAGARALVPEDDLRVLQAVLLELALPGPPVRPSAGQVPLSGKDSTNASV